MSTTTETTAPASSAYLLQLTEANHDDNEFYALGGAGFLTQAERQASIDRIRAASDLTGHSCQDPDVHHCYVIDVLDPADQFTVVDNFEIDEQTAHDVLGVADFEPLRTRERTALAAVADAVLATPADATTLRALGAEFGLTPDGARAALELDVENHPDDVALTPVTATAFRLVLRSQR